MTSWDEGYVSDHAYVNAYFPQLSPTYLKAILLLSGFPIPQSSQNEPLRYLELGFGQGLSLNIHAAIDQETEFWGTDFIPDQALNAKKIATDLQLGTKILNLSFEEFDQLAATDKLPCFDMITLHGIWSWISEENRSHIIRIIQKLLKPGGVVYVNYNSLPGRTDLSALRKLIELHARKKSEKSDSTSSAIAAAQFVRQLIDSKARYFIENDLAEGIQDVLHKDPIYLAHEFLNQNWTLFYFKDVAGKLLTADCIYATSYPHINSFGEFQPDGTLELIGNVTNVIARETLRDFNLNKAFRTDIYIKQNSTPIDQETIIKQMNQLCFTINPFKFIREKIVSVQVSLIKVDLDQSVMKRFFDIFIENNYQPKSIVDIQSHPRMQGIQKDYILYCINMLLGEGYIWVVGTKIVESSKSACQRFNRYFGEELKLEMSTGAQYMLSPYLSHAFLVSAVFYLCALAYSNGNNSQNDIVNEVEKMLSVNQKVWQVETEEGNKGGREAILWEAKRFEQMKPFLIKMQCIPF